MFHNQSTFLQSNGAIQIKVDSEDDLDFDSEAELR